MLKAWKEERDEDKRRYEQCWQEQQNCFKQLVQGLTERRPHQVEVGPESLKLTKLADGDDIEAFLTTFGRALVAHGVHRDKHTTILAPQLTGKACVAYAAMTDPDAKDCH